MIKFLKKSGAKQPKIGISVGLDIGSCVIKSAKIIRDKEKAVLVSFNIEPRPPEVAALIKKMVDPKDARRINFSVSGPASIIRYVTFPKMNNEELSQSLKFEAQKHIPFAINEVNLDGYIMRQDLAENKMLVLVAAVKKEFLNQRLSTLKEAGLAANLVDIDSIALVNAFNFNYAQDANLKGNVVALLNIGAQECNLNILEDGLPRLSRDIHIGGNNFTQKLADTMGLDFKAAEELKINPDPERLEKVNSVIEVVLTNLAKDLRNSFDYYESQSVSSVSKIFLSGGGSLCKGLADGLSGLLGIGVSHWDPLKAITLGDTLDAAKLKASSSQLAVAIGLALRY